jgi:hypothetical protein
VLQVLDRSGIVERTGTAMRFYQMRPLMAIKMVLHEKGPQTQAQLMKELEDGGIAIGNKRGMHNPRISLEKTLRNGSLQQVGDLIGLPEWKEEKFTEPESQG